MKYSDETINRLAYKTGFHVETVKQILELLESIDEQKKLRADAERWRYWLREHGWSGYFDDGLTSSESDADIIAAIDKAREASGGGFSPSALRDAQLAHADKAREA